MAMNEALILALAWMAGAGLGVIFFGGLWWTLRRGLVSPRPALWLLGGLLLRTGLVLAGFYAVADGHWERLLACLLGFALARSAAIRLAGPPLEYSAHPAREAGHAPESR